jgi:penicillin-binding protein 1A
VGSRDFAQEQFDHVSQARRQPGSTFKPFVYGAAFVQGLSPEYAFIDAPVSIPSEGGGIWMPSDETPPTERPMSLRDGLAYSKNTITAQLMQQVGPAAVAQLAQALGVRSSKLDLVPSLALGTSPVTLVEMVAAYGSIANGGHYLMPVLVASVEDRNGQMLETFEPVRESAVAMPRAQALTLVDVMRGVIDQGTGSAIRQRYGIQADVAGKTGTTQDNSDGWFILMHPQLVAGAWVGFNDNSSTMGPWGQGARSALPMVGDVFQQALRSRWLDQNAEFDIPRRRPPPPKPPGPPEAPPNSPLVDMVNGLIGKFFKQLQ